MMATRTDCYCTACGFVIKGLTTAMIAKCPLSTCGEKIPLRFGAEEEEFDEHGWGRCRNCKSFMHRDHVHCQACGNVNVVAKEKKVRLQKQALLKRRHQLKLENEVIASKMSRMEEEKAELDLGIASQETELMKLRAQMGKGGIPLKAGRRKQACPPAPKDPAGSELGEGLQCQKSLFEKYS